MLSYRHGFHAGNHADVLKHIALVALLRILARKDKPLLVVDTHAGAGQYDLGGSVADSARRGDRIFGDRSRDRRPEGGSPATGDQQPG